MFPSFTFYWSAAKDLDKDCSRPSTQSWCGRAHGCGGRGTVDVGKYDTWPDVGKNYANTGEHFRFQWNYVFAAYLLLFTCFVFGFFFSSLSSSSSPFCLVRYYSHTISLRHISFDYGFDGSACELQAKQKGNEMKWIWKWKWHNGEKRRKTTAKRS